MQERRRGLWEGIEAHIDSRDVARILYGAVVGLSLVIALQFHPPGPGKIAATIAGTAVAIGLAELYADFVATEVRTQARVRRGQLRALAAQAVSVTFGAGFPAVFFILAAAGAIQTHLAFTLSKWSGLGLICGYGFIAGRLAGSPTSRALVHAAAVGSIGGALIALKALLH
jgi:hypothetical protein